MSHSDNPGIAAGQPGDEMLLVRLMRLAHPRPTAPPAVEAAVRERVRSEWQRQVAARRRRKPVLAATLVTGLAAGLVVWIGGLWPGATPVTAGTVLRSAGTVRVQAETRASGWVLLRSGDVNAGSRIATDRSGRVALRLANGTGVRLDHATELGIEAADRLTLARGRIYIDTHAPGAAGGSVLVHTISGAVSDLGTQFEVAHVADSVRVRVREGAIVVDGASGRIQGGSGEEMLIQRNGHVERSRLATFGEHWAWVGEIAPPFDIDGHTLLEFLSWVGRETGREVEFADRSSEQAARATRLHGSVEGFTPGEALAAVLATTRLRDAGDERVLLIRIREPADEADAPLQDPS